MNRSSPFHFINKFGDQVWLFHFNPKSNLKGLQDAYCVLVVIETIFHILYIISTAYLVCKAFRYPPVHPNLVLITNHTITMLALSCLGRLGQILYESQIIDEQYVSSPLRVLSHLRVIGCVTVTRYGMGIYIERCLALRFVRDYERKQRIYIGATYVIQDVILSNLIAWLFTSEYLPGYPCTLFAIVPHTVCFRLIQNLLKENEIRLEMLNNRDIRRPHIDSKLSIIPKKFFGDSSKDIYTLSMRLQLDENIWCCRQLDRGNVLVILALAVLVILFTVPPLFPYTLETEWILNLLVIIANLLFPIGIFIVEVLIAWSLEKMRSNVFPFWLIAWINEASRKNDDTSVEFLKISVSEQYFDQLSLQWERAFNIVHEMSNTLKRN